jgi:hypothetical protein
MKIQRLKGFLNEEMSKVIMTPEIKVVEDQMNQIQLAIKGIDDKFAKKEIKEPDMLKLKSAETKKIADLMSKKADLLQVEMNKKS